MRSVFAMIAPLLIGGGLLVPAIGCLAPTQVAIFVRATPDLCATGVPLRAAIYVGESRGVELDTIPTGVFDLPCDGTETTFYVVPSGAGNDIGVRVVANPAGSGEACDRTAAYAGCVVSRRRLTFVPHETLRVEITMTGACLGQDSACGHYGAGTCAGEGLCRYADVDEAACVSNICTDSSLRSDLARAEILDASSPAPIDADLSTPTDASLTSETGDP